MRISQDQQEDGAALHNRCKCSSSKSHEKTENWGKRGSKNGMCPIRITRPPGARGGTLDHRLQFAKACVLTVIRWGAI